MASRKSPEHRAIYSNIQSFASTGNDLILTLLRAEPQIADEGTRYRDGEPDFIEEAVVYIPLGQAKDMCEKILRMIDKSDGVSDEAPTPDE